MFYIAIVSTLAESGHAETKSLHEMIEGKIEVSILPVREYAMDFREVATPCDTDKLFVGTYVVEAEEEEDAEEKALLFFSAQKILGYDDM